MRAIRDEDIKAVLELILEQADNLGVDRNYYLDWMARMLINLSCIGDFKNYE